MSCPRCKIRYTLEPFKIKSQNREILSSATELIVVIQVPAQGTRCSLSTMDMGQYRQVLKCRALRYQLVLKPPWSQARDLKREETVTLLPQEKKSITRIKQRIRVLEFYKLHFLIIIWITAPLVWIWGSSMEGNPFEAKKEGEEAASVWVVGIWCGFYAMTLVVLFQLL